MQSSNNIRLGYKAVHMNGHVYMYNYTQTTTCICAENHKNVCCKLCVCSLFRVMINKTAGK